MSYKRGSYLKEACMEDMLAQRTSLSTEVSIEGVNNLLYSNYFIYENGHSSKKGSYNPEKL